MVFKQSKKIIVGLLLGVMLLGNTAVVEALPREKAVRVQLEGREIHFPDQKPMIKNGRTLVPARTVFEEMGAKVTWNEEARTVTVEKEENTVKLAIGSDVLLKNGEEIRIDVPAEIINDRTMLPLRAVVEAMDCYIAWAREQNTAHIYTKSTSTERNTFLKYRFGLSGPFVTYDVIETAYGTVIQDILAYAPHRTSYNLYLLDAEGNIKNLDEAVPVDSTNNHPRAEYIALWGDGKTLTYSVHYDERTAAMTIDEVTGEEIEKVYYEAGTYYFSADLETGECKETNFVPEGNTK